MQCNIKLWPIMAIGADGLGRALGVADRLGELERRECRLADHVDRLALALDELRRQAERVGRDGRVGDFHRPVNEIEASPVRGRGLGR